MLAPIEIVGAVRPTVTATSYDQLIPRSFGSARFPLKMPWRPVRVVTGSVMQPELLELYALECRC